MAVLNPTELMGRVSYLGINPSRNDTHFTHAVERVDLTCKGIVGEAHSGFARHSCGRVTQQYEKASEIRNSRQISILSREDLEHTARTMGVPEIRPEYVGASIVRAGLSFSQ